jgi:hypothetical protein
MGQRKLRSDVSWPRGVRAKRRETRGGCIHYRFVVEVSFPRWGKQRTSMHCAPANQMSGTDSCIERNAQKSRLSQWPRGLKRWSATARVLRWWVRIPLGAWKFFRCECRVLSGFCDELITRPEESYRLWCVIVCDLETSGMRRLWPTGGLSRQEQTNTHKSHMWTDKRKLWMVAAMTPAITVRQFRFYHVKRETVAVHTRDLIVRTIRNISSRARVMVTGVQQSGTELPGWIPSDIEILTSMNLVDVMIPEILHDLLVAETSHWNGLMTSTVEFGKNKKNPLRCHW